MAAKSAQVMTESDDGDDGDDEARGTAGSDVQVLSPITTPPISRGGPKADQATQFEIVEVDEDDNPIGDAGSGRAREADLSQDRSGDRPVIDAAQDADGRRQPSYRRESNAERRERKKVARDRDKQEVSRLRRELDDLRGQMSDFSGRVEPKLSEFDASRAQGQITQIDNDIARHSATIKAAEIKQREAMGNNDADAFIAAQSAREEAVIAKVRLEARKEQLSAVQARSEQGRQRADDGSALPPQPVESARRQAAAPPLPLSAQRYAREFQDNHDWIDPNSRDLEVRRDSRRALFLDNEVAADGFDPATPEYWEELENRMREAIPRLADEDEVPAPRAKQNGGRVNGNGAAGNGRAAPASAAPATRRGPMMADVGGRGNGSGKTQVKITPERKRAMIETGSLAIDGTIADEAKFKRQVAKYMEFDRANGAGQ